MNYKITEVQDKKTTRVYNITGPKRETIESFWEYLVARNVIESYELTES
jgi:hypothetical protein